MFAFDDEGRTNKAGAMPCRHGPVCGFRRRIKPQTYQMQGQEAAGEENAKQLKKKLPIAIAIQSFTNAPL
jgi:hypothetical protein